jgi:TPR repeat protein
LQSRRYSAELQKCHAQDTTAAEQKEMAATRQNADRGDAVAQFNLGVAYGLGQGVPQNYTQAEVWSRKAADEGYPAARRSQQKSQPLH